MGPALRAAPTGSRSAAGAALLAAGLALALIGGLALTGEDPGGKILERFEPRGVVAAIPSDIRVVELRQGRDRIAFRRQDAKTWLLDGAAPKELSADLSAHLETALRFMHVSAPARTLDTGDYRGSDLADFGLAPPAYVVSLAGADGAVAVADFGTLSPAQTSQYVRLLGRPEIFLLPRHVGGEWQLVADIARRSFPPDATAAEGPAAARGLVGGFLLPTSIEEVWAVEIVAAGKLHRFERDSSGTWFLHVGQHSHAGGAPAHVADPAKARAIDAALAGFGAAQIESLVAPRPSGDELVRFGLDRPPLIALLYARDTSNPLARVEFGSMAADKFSCYARVADGGAVVTVAVHEAQRLYDLIAAAGVRP